MEGAIRRIWWTVSIVCAALMAGGVSLVLQARDEASTKPPAVARAAIRAPVAAPIAAPTSSVNPPTKPPPVAGIASPASRDGARMIEVCGIDAVRLSSAASDADNDHQLDEAVANASVPWNDMQSSGDERVRAAGFALAGRIEPLVKLAAQTRDAVVYAMAQGACMRIARDASGVQPADLAWCETLATDRRSTLEPDNAEAWLVTAADAHVNQDAQAVDDALRRAATAPTFTHHATAAATQVERYANAARPALASLWVHRALEETGLHEAVVPPSICADRQSPSRREACQQIAHRLLDQPQAIGDLALGLALGRQIGVDEATLTRRREELEAVQAAETERLEAWSGSDRFSCATLARKRDWLRKQQGIGEWRAARDAAIAKAGSLEALLQRHRGRGTGERGTPR